MVYGVVLVFVVFGTIELGRVGALAPWSVAATLGSVLLVFATIRIAVNHTVLRSAAARPVAPWVLVLTGTVLGVAAAGAQWVALIGQGASLGFPVPGILAGTVVRTALFFPLIAYLVGLRRWYMSERSAAARALVQAEEEAISAGDALQATRAVLIDAARSELGPAHREATGLLDAAVRTDSRDDWSRAAESLRSAARSAVRSTSHGLWVDEGRAAPTIRWRSVIPGALVRYPLPLMVPGVLMAGFVLIRSDVSNERPVVSVAVMLSAVVAFAAAYLLGRFIIAGLPATAVAVSVLVPAAVALGVQFIGEAATGYAPSPEALVWAPLALVAVTLATSVALMVRDSGAAVIQALVDDRSRADAARAAFDGMNARLSRELASHLHATVQPRLVAASVALDEAVGSGDPAARARAVEQAEAALRMDDVAPEPDVPSPDLAVVLAGLRSRWAAIIALQVRAPESAHAAGADDVARVLDECLNNAVVHGRAAAAIVQVHHRDGEWHLEVADDGVGPSGGPAGLGTALIDRLTRGQWSLQRGPDGGAVMRAALPAPPRA